jgi:hypothetical protein
MAGMERPATTLSINAFTQIKAPFPPGMRMPPQFGGPERLHNPDPLKEAGDSVLLVDDAIKTGRMLAVAARMLRRSGRGGVTAGPGRTSVAHVSPSRTVGRDIHDV